jgi:hypothetical protein
VVPLSGIGVAGTGAEEPLDSGLLINRLAKQAAGLDAGQGHPLEILAPLDRDLPAGLHLPGRPGDAATSIAPAKPTSAGTPTPRQHRDHNELRPP